jgi:N-methylhydantoinase B
MGSRPGPRRLKGGDGSMMHSIDGRPINAKARVELPAGARLTVREAGAGGFGDPRKRDPGRVLADVREGFVSPKAALKDYGVKVDVRRGTATRPPAKKPAAGK